MGVPYFTPYIPSPEGRGFTAHWIKRYSGKRYIYRDTLKEKREKGTGQVKIFIKIL